MAQTLSLAVFQIIVPCIDGIVSCPHLYPRRKGTNKGMILSEKDSDYCTHVGLIFNLTNAEKKTQLAHLFFHIGNYFYRPNWIAS